MDTSLFRSNIVESKRILYTPSAFAKTNLLHLQEIGELKAKTPHTSQRSNLTSYLFFLVLEGTGTVSYNGISYTMNPGDCAFLDCHFPYSHCSSENLWSLNWVHFYGPNMSGIYEKYIQRGGMFCFPSQKKESYTTLLQELYEIANSDLYVKDMKICEKLTSLLTLLMEESWNQTVDYSPASSKKREMQLIKKFLDEHYTEKITLDTLSEKFFINKYYLTRIFKEQFDISITNYLIHIRVTHAKQLLRFSQLSIEEIAHACGLKDANYFSRMFRKVEGIAPGEFRKLWKNKTN